MNDNIFDLIVVGGGAAGFFGAIRCAEFAPKSRVLILEATPRYLTKVRVSGGGRCNVTHNCFEAKALIGSYPRGSKELLGPFHKFGPKDMMEWLARRGVVLKAEADGRVFPANDKSQTIVACFESACRELGVEVRTKALVQDLVYDEAQGFSAILKSGERFIAKNVLLATGSMEYGHKLVLGLGHSLVPPVPSLFTFEIVHPLLAELSGLSFPKLDVQLKAGDQLFKQSGPLLITHWGLSGPAVLKLSAFAARALAACSYQATLWVNWQGQMKPENCYEQLLHLKTRDAKKLVRNTNPLEGAKRFWETLLTVNAINPDKNWADLSNKDLRVLAEALTRSEFKVTGKGLFKEEFVTAGGIDRTEVDFKSFQSKLCPGLYFAGEILDIDGVTGGFNFQNAWTGATLAAASMAEKIRGQ